MIRGLLLLPLLLASDPFIDLGPMVGHVGPDEARIWIKSSGPCAFTVKVSVREDLTDVRVVRGPDPEAASLFMTHARIDGLEPSTRYFYAVCLDGKPAQAQPYPSFVTAPRPGEKVKFRFAFGSCVGKEGYHAAAAWADMAARTKFDLLLLLGDNHYADSTDPEKQRAAYASHRRPAGYAEITRRTPTYAIWDDHDFGPNNSDRTARGKEDALRVFKEHWANPAYGQPDDPGVYFRFSWGDVDFFMLDSRYYRTPNATKEDGKKTMLGEKQLAWIKRELAASKAALKFVGCGSEFQVNTQPDCWSSFLRERKDLFDFIEEKKIQGLIFLSGDRHFTGGYQMDGRWIEITSGPLGSSNALVPVYPDMFLRYVEGKLYTVFEVDTTGPEPAATLEVYKAAQGLLEKRPFSWAQITGAEKLPTLPIPPKK